MRWVRKSLDYCEQLGRRAEREERCEGKRERTVQHCNIWRPSRAGRKGRAEIIIITMLCCSDDTPVIFSDNVDVQSCQHLWPTVFFHYAFALYGSNHFIWSYFTPFFKAIHLQLLEMIKVLFHFHHKAYYHNVPWWYCSVRNCEQQSSEKSRPSITRLV